MTAQLVQHRAALLASRRCGACAERVPSQVLLRGQDCPTCGSALSVGADDEVLGALRSSWKERRLRVLGMAFLVSFAGGWIPLLQGAIMLALLVYVHVRVVREPLRWLPPGRRVAARVLIKLIAVAIAVADLALNAVVVPFLGIGAAVLSVSGLVGTALYAEISLRLVERRLQWERDGRPLSTGEWLLPAVLLGLIIGAVGAGVGALWALFETLDWLQGGFVRQVAEWLAGWLG